MNKKSILVIEDNAELRSALTTKLSLKGYSINSTWNGLEGLKISLATQPDLILLDLLMPSMDGITMMNHLRQDPWGMTVPIIILTNLQANDEVINNIMANHPAYYCIKSDTPIDTLVEKIKNILD